MTREQFASVVMELKGRLDDADKALAEIREVQKQVAALQNNTIERSKLVGIALCRLIALEKGETPDAVFQRHSAAVGSNKTGHEYVKAVIGE